MNWYKPIISCNIALWAIIQYIGVSVNRCRYNNEIITTKRRRNDVIVWFSARVRLRI